MSATGIPDCGEGVAGVYTREGSGRARLKTVEIGRRNAAEADGKGEINEGATVILHPTNRIQDELRVEAG